MPMGITLSNHPAPAEREAADQNPHFVRSVTETGERQDLVAQEDIYAANGMKLLAKGARIDRSKLERLTEHKLKVPLDLLLSATDSVNRASLSADMDRELGLHPVLARLSLRSGDQASLKFVLGRMTLPDPVAFRLTVMRDDRRDLYEHTLRVAIVAHYLGLRLGLDDGQLENLMLASLLHDLGEMHTDPALLAPGRRLEPGERSYIYVHPITSYVVLKQLKVDSAEVGQAVLQHHERLDGSGYPYGLTDRKIGLLARILGIAELQDAPLRNGDTARLHVILRLNRHRFDAEVVDTLRDLLGVEPARTGQQSNLAYAGDYMSRLVGAFRQWHELRRHIEAASDGHPLRFVMERVSVLRTLTLQAGVDAELIAALDLEGEDAEVLAELLFTLGEIRHMLNDLLHEVVRRTGSAAAGDPLVARMLELLQGVCTVRA